MRLRTRSPRCFRTLTALLAVGACSRSGFGHPRASEPRSADYLFVWTTDADSADLNFLAVLDAREGSETYGNVVATLPIPTVGRTRGHHTEHVMPKGGLLFANDFGTGKTYLLDLRHPLRPALADSFTAAGDLTAPHSFERLANGNVLVTFQNRGAGNHEPGGLAELDPHGRLVRASSAASGDRFIRPYSLAVVPRLDRVVTGSADMMRGGDSRVVQVWRLSDLELLRTIRIPDDWGDAAEPRLLDDGRTVLIATFGCALLRVVGLDAEPRAEVAYRFPGANCAVPAVSGRFWIQTVPALNGLVALDVSQPDHPKEVGRLVLGANHWPHWISLKPGGRRIVITGYQGTRYRVIVAKLDPTTGALALDSAFGRGGSGPGVSFDRPSWPHGASGPGDPHGAVFSLPAEASSNNPRGR